MNVQVFHTPDCIVPCHSDKQRSRWASLLGSFTLYRTAGILGPVIEELLVQTPKGGHIAEIGFGSGMTAILLADLGFRVTALDIDPDVIDLLRDRIGDIVELLASNAFFNKKWADLDDIELLKNKIGHIEGLYVQKQDMFDLHDFENNHFDVMYHQGVLEHFSDEEIVRTLNQQGRVARKVIFDVPNDMRKEKYQLYGNERFLPVKHWCGLIRRAGLQVEKVCGRRLPKWADILPKRWHHRDSWLAKWKGESNTYVCKNM